MPAPGKGRIRRGPLPGGRPGLGPIFVLVLSILGVASLTGCFQHSCSDEGLAELSAVVDYLESETGLRSNGVYAADCEDSGRAMGLLVTNPHVVSQAATEKPGCTYNEEHDAFVCHGAGVDFLLRGDFETQESFESAAPISVQIELLADFPSDD